MSFNLNDLKNILENLRKAVDEKKRWRHTEWKPREDYTPEEQKAIQEHIDAGYSHREAERLAGAHKGPKDFTSGLKSNIAPSMPSDKMLQELKDLAGPFLDNAKKMEEQRADINVNPVKYAEGKMRQAHEAHTADYGKDYHSFLSSDELRGLSRKDRHRAIREWKKNWHEQNPNYKEGIADVSRTQQVYGEADKIAKQNLHDKIQHIMQGGQVESESPMSAQEAAQHLGVGTKDEPASQQISAGKTSTANFAERYPDLMNKLSEEHKGRLKEIDSAKNAQSAAPTVIRRRRRQ